MYAHLGFDLPQDSCSTLYEIHSGDDTFLFRIRNYNRAPMD